MKSLKILFVGNSFAVDTMEHTAKVAKALGIEELHFGTLYVGGCPIALHYEHASQDLPAYTYYTNTGDGWNKREGVSIRTAIQSAAWDWIAIQHGTKGSARYTSPECYEKLTPLLEWIKALAPQSTKIAFNLTWMGEPDFSHHEILSYGGDTLQMRKKLEEVTGQMVLTNPLVDLLTPTGTAIENARTAKLGLLTRDGYHLSLDTGRYLAALTFLGAITGLALDGISWAPEGVDAYARKVALWAAKQALRAPLTVTKWEP